MLILTPHRQDITEGRTMEDSEGGEKAGNGRDIYLESIYFGGIYSHSEVWLRTCAG
jgi:hypothetical protein